MRGYSALAVVAALSGLARADEPAESITASASATVFIKPDSARIHYTVRGNDSTADGAKDAVAKQITTVNDAIKALKFSDLTTSVGAATFDRIVTRNGAAGRFGGPGNPNGNPGPAPISTIHYAIVPLTATIRENDADKLRGSVELFVKRVTEVGGQVANDPNDDESPFVGMQGGLGSRSRLSSQSPRIEWLVTDDTSARKEAYRAAVRKAKANAEAISKEIGWETLKVISVVDGASQPRDNSEPTPRAPAGEVAVTAKVTLKFSR
jgi:Protein of unknown function (DUF541)